MKTAIVLTLAVLAQAIGNTCLSKGMKVLASESQLGDSLSLLLLVRAMETPLIWLGTALLFVFFVLFSATLSWADLSFVLPASSFGYVLNVAFARHFLNEPVSGTRWLGTAFILLGVLLVSRSAGGKSAKKVKPANELQTEPNGVRK